MKFNMFKLGDKNKNTAPEKPSRNKAETDAGETDIDISKIVDVAPSRPHGPAEELTLGDGLNDDIALDEIDESTEDIKLGEVKAPEKSAVKPSAFKTASVPVSGAESSAVQSAAIKVEDKSADNATNDLNSLFSTDEEEENPLAALINSMPDVTAREILDDLEEIHRIIKEWKPNQGGGGIPR